MNKKIVLLLFFFALQKNNAQVIKTEVKDSTSQWVKVNKVGLDISQISFVNWNAGGNNSVSGLLKGNFIRAYIKGNFHWKNSNFLKVHLFP